MRQSPKNPEDFREPSLDFTCSAEVNSACAKILLPQNACAAGLPADAPISQKSRGFSGTLFGFHLLGGSKFRLRQDFAAAKCLCRRTPGEPFCHQSIRALSPSWAITSRQNKKRPAASTFVETTGRWTLGRGSLRYGLGFSCGSACRTAPRRPRCNLADTPPAACRRRWDRSPGCFLF